MSFTERALHDLRQTIKHNPDLLRYKTPNHEEDEKDEEDEEDKKHAQESNVLSYTNISKLSVQKLIYVENIRISTLYADTRHSLATLEAEYDDIERKYTALKAEHNNLELDNADTKTAYTAVKSNAFSVQMCLTGALICSVSCLVGCLQFFC